MKRSILILALSATALAQGASFDAKLESTQLPIDVVTIENIQGTNIRVECVSDASGAVTEMVFHQGTRQDRAGRGDRA